MPIVLAVGLAALALRIGIDVGQPLLADDIWWHVALGRVFLAAGRLPTIEPLLFTSAGHPQFYHEWLFQLAAAELEQWGGMLALRLTQGVLTAAIVQQVYAFARSQGLDRRLALVAALTLPLFAYQRLVQLRPELVSILGFYALLNLYCVPRLTRARVALLLALLVLWANAHATVLIVFPFLAAYLVAGGAELAVRSRRHLWTLVAAVLAPTLNPQAARIYYFYLLHDDNNPLVRVVDEWGRIFVIPRGFAHVLPWSSPLVLWCFGLVTLAIVLLALRRLYRSRGERPPASEPYRLLWAALALCAAAFGVRFLWLLPVAVVTLLHAGGQALAPAGRRCTLVLGCVAVLIAHLAGPDTRGYRYPLNSEALAGWTSPSAVQRKFLPEAIAAIAASRYSGNLYAPYGISGYASYVLHPRVRLFLNGRYDSYSRAVYDDHFRALAGGRTLQAIIERYGIDAFLVPLSDDYYALVYSLAVMGWCEGYRDDTALWLIAPTAGAACPAQLSVGGDLTELPTARADVGAALRHALTHQRYAEAARIAGMAAAPPARVSHTGLCALHARLEGELGAVAARPLLASVAAAHAFCAGAASAGEP